MWICLNNAFLSVVHKDCAEDELLVRARVAGHIEAVFPGVAVVRTPGNDYLYRAAVKREAVAAALTAQAMGIGYGNFKNTVRDRALHDAYARVWGVMANLQEFPPYGGR